MWHFQNQFLCLWVYALQDCSSIQNLSLNPLKNSNSLLLCIAIFMCTLVICYNSVTKFTAGALTVLVTGADCSYSLWFVQMWQGLAVAANAWTGWCPTTAAGVLASATIAAIIATSLYIRYPAQTGFLEPRGATNWPRLSTMWPSHLLSVHAAHQGFWPWLVFALSVSPLPICVLCCPIGFYLQHKFKVKIMSFKTVRADYWTKCKIPEWPHKLHVLLLDLSLCMEVILSPENLRSQCAEIFEP